MRCPAFVASEKLGAEVDAAAQSFVLVNESGNLRS